jgi:hypothetical protein
MLIENAIGQRQWVIPEGYIPSDRHIKSAEFASHEAFCVLNTGNEDAHIEVIIFYADREPVGPYRLTVPARRTRHFRFNDLREPETIPVGTSYASVIQSDQPVVVQHTRLDSRQSESALMTTIAYPSASTVAPQP